MVICRTSPKCSFPVSFKVPLGNSARGTPPPRIRGSAGQPPDRNGLRKGRSGSPEDVTAGHAAEPVPTRTLASGTEPVRELLAAKKKWFAAEGTSPAQKGPDPHPCTPPPHPPSPRLGRGVDPDRLQSETAGGGAGASQETWLGALRPPSSHPSVWSPAVLLLLSTPPAAAGTSIPAPACGRSWPRCCCEWWRLWAGEGLAPGPGPEAGPTWNAAAGWVLGRGGCEAAGVRSHRAGESRGGGRSTQRVSL